MSIFAPPKGFCFALMAAVMERSGGSVQRRPNASRDRRPRHRPVWNAGLPEEERAYLRGWQSDMESFDRF